MMVSADPGAQLMSSTDLPDPGRRSATRRVQREPWMTPKRLLGLIAVVIGAYLALIIVRQLRSVLIMLLVSVFLSFAMEPAVQFLARRGVRRGLATAGVFFGVLLIAAGIIAAMVPLFIEQATDLIQSVPRSVEELNDLIAGLPFLPSIPLSPDLRNELTSYAGDFGNSIRTALFGAAGNVVSFGASAVGALFQFLAIGLVTFYLVADGPKLRQTLFRPFPPDRQRELLSIWEIAVAKTGGYIYSRVLLAVASAVAHLIVLLILDVPFALPLALWVGIMSAFVPVVGTYIGGILLVLVALANEPLDALWIGIFIIVYQQAENYLVAPKVQSHTMDVHPAVAFVSVLIGGTLLGAVGALLALPATAIIQALASTYIRSHGLISELDDPDASVPEPPVDDEDEDS